MDFTGGIVGGQNIRKCDFCKSMNCNCCYSDDVDNTCYPSGSENSYLFTDYMTKLLVGDDLIKILGNIINVVNVKTGEKRNSDGDKEDSENKRVKS